MSATLSLNGEIIEKGAKRKILPFFLAYIKKK